MGACSAYNCSNHPRNKIRMFRFPLDPERRKKWAINCRRESWEPSPNSRLCIVHFEENQFELNRDDGWKKLKSTAIPTLFDVPNPPEKLSMKRKKGIGLPKPGSLLDSNTNEASTSQDPEGMAASVPNLMKRIAFLEEQNRLLSNQLKEKDCSLSFLSEEQVKATHNVVTCWSSDSVIKGLKLRFALGKHGYNYLRSTGYPSPSYSTLNRRIQDINVDFGILHMLIRLLKTKIENMTNLDKFCCIMIDEMEISSNLDFDAANKSFVGNITMDSHVQTGVVGSQYAVILLRGLKSPWKQIVAHEITGKSTSGLQMKKLMSETVKAAQSIGLIVKASISDMGSKNRAMWKEFNVCVSRSERQTAYQVSGSDELIYTIADVPHLLKNMRGSFLSNVLVLPESVCGRESLPTKVISSGYLKQLWISEIDSDTSLRSLHHLNKSHLFPTHFTSMNVATAVQLFSVKTAAALEKAVTLKQVSKEALTTAWWIRIIHQWFTLMTAKHCKVAITLKNKDVKFDFLRDFIEIVQQMQFGLSWKPLQTGLIMSSLSVIKLAEECFTQGFKFFLPGRLSQDALENVFSQIRRKSASKPTALQARRALKLICVSQFISDIKYSNYASDSDIHLLDLIHLESAKSDSVSNTQSPSSVPQSVQCLTTIEENDIYYLAGATLNAILKQKCCSLCTDSVQRVLDPNEPDIPEQCKYLGKYCDMGGLKTPPSGLFRICKESERLIRHHKSDLLLGKMHIDEVFIQAVIRKCEDINLPKCCFLKDKIIKHYLMVRCKGIKTHLISKKAHATSFASPSTNKKQKKIK